ncbi:uncharacterized protein LOC132643889 [Lycium barbarum]|uniref:uncharacterized protein LOC132643889 n=1 Tax=Lycium barbarum TaxID=112863 RepID=UPI00293EDA0C|nr:uncharacterized protein LOC132643889 [Lycium barbarum]
MVKVFLRKWYPPSKRAEIRDQIYEFKQRNEEQLFEAWERYKEYLDRNTKPWFPISYSEGEVLQSQAWNSSSLDGLSLGTPSIQNIVKDNQVTQQALAQLATNISLPTKRIDEREPKKQIRDLSREQHPARKGGLPSDTIPNSKNGGSVKRTFAVSTRRGKIFQSADKKEVDLDPVIEQKEETDDKRGFSPFDTDVQNVVKEMPGFAKFVNDLLTKKRSVQHETVNLTHRVSLIIASTTVQNKGDPGAFTILCNIGLHAFARALCDNGSSINLMPLAIFKQSVLGMPRPTSMRLQMADKSIKKPVGVIDDVLVQVGKFMLPVDFVILYCAVDKDIPIILGRPFLATGRALMDSEKNKIKF